MDNIYIDFDNFFWKVINETLIISKGDYIKQTETLEKKLIELDDHQVLFLFHSRFTQLRLQAYRWNIKLAFTIITKSNDEDDFYNFREWIIMQGKNNYYSILANPDLLVNAKKEDIIKAIEILETIGYLPQKILKNQKTSYILHFESEMPGDDWANTEIDPKKLLPNLWEKYNQ